MRYINQTSALYRFTLTVMFELLEVVFKCDPTPANKALCSKINFEL